MFNNPTQNPRVSIGLLFLYSIGRREHESETLKKVAQQINELEIYEEKVDIELNIRQV